MCASLILKPSLFVSLWRFILINLCIYFVIYFDDLDPASLPVQWVKLRGVQADWDVTHTFIVFRGINARNLAVLHHLLHPLLHRIHPTQPRGRNSSVKAANKLN